MAEKARGLHQGVHSTEVGVEMSKAIEIVNTKGVPPKYLANLKRAEKESRKLIAHDYLNKIILITDDEYYEFTGDNPSNWQASFFIDYSNYYMYIPTSMWDEPYPILISDMCHEKQHLSHNRIMDWIIKTQAKNKMSVQEYRLLSEIICKESAYLFLLQYNATKEQIGLSGSSYRNRQIAIAEARKAKGKIERRISFFDVLQFMVFSASPVHTPDLIYRLSILFDPRISVQNYLSM